MATPIMITSFVLTTTLLTGVLSPTVANFAFVGWGSTNVWLADLPATIGRPPHVPVRPSKLGYRFSFFNILGLDVITYGGSYCVYDDTGRFRLLNRIEAAAMMSPGALPGPPFEYRYPMGWIVFGVVLGLGLPVALLRRGLMKRQRDQRSFLGP